MNTLLNKHSGNITLVSIILSGIIIGFGITVISVVTSSIISTTNIKKSSVAYYEAEAGAEKGYYIFAGHGAGFEYNYDNDATCEIESGEDTWCLQGRLNNLPEDGGYTTLQDNGTLSIGLYNDTSSNPFGATSSTNVDLVAHALEIYLYPPDGSEAVSNNQVGTGDIRVTSVTAGSTTYDEKTLVENGNSDIGIKLESSETAGDCNSANYAITGSDRVWDTGEFVYRDIDLSESVSMGDIRMIQIGSFGAGTTVIISDSDIGTALYSGVSNIACDEDNVDYLYSTDVAQIVISGVNDDGNKSLIRVISKNQLQGHHEGNPLVYDEGMLRNVSEVDSNCSIQKFLKTNSSDCGHTGQGDMTEPQLSIYSFSTDLDYKIESTFSDFNINNVGDDCALCNFIQIGADSSSTDYSYFHISDTDVTSNIPNGTYSLPIKEYDYASPTGETASESFETTDATTNYDLAFLIQTALNNTDVLINDYSVSYRDSRFQITSTGITLTNPETTLVSKGEYENFQQSIETSITDSSLVPVFGWYSVF